MTHAIPLTTGDAVRWNHDAYGKHLTLHGVVTHLGVWIVQVQDSIGNNWTLPAGKVSRD